MGRAETSPEQTLVHLYNALAFRALALFKADMLHISSMKEEQVNTASFVG